MAHQCASAHWLKNVGLSWGCFLGLSTFRLCWIDKRGLDSVGRLGFSPGYPTVFLPEQARVISAVARAGGAFGTEREEPQGAIGRKRGKEKKFNTHPLLKFFRISPSCFSFKKCVYVWGLRCTYGHVICATLLGMLFRKRKAGPPPAISDFFAGKTVIHNDSLFCSFADGWSQEEVKWKNWKYVLFSLNEKNRWRASTWKPVSFY